MDDEVKLAALLLLMPFGVMAMILAIIVGDPSLSPENLMLIMAAGLIVVSLVMFTGRGSWAVAGYNSMTSEEKTQYDPKRISRGCGFMMLGTAVFLALLMQGGLLLMLGLTVMAVSFVAGIVYMNRYARL